MSVHDPKTDHGWRRTLENLAVVGVIWVAAPVAAAPGGADDSGAIIAVRRTAVTGIGREEGVVRRDPSDVVRVGDLDYVFYTKVARGAPLYPSGYGGTVWYATSDDEGHTWRERGEAIGPGEAGRFDATGVFTPNVVLGPENRLYLYYTGVGDGFDNRPGDYGPLNRTAIGVARLGLRDDGVIVSTVRLNGGEPVLVPSAANERRFDSFRVDDAAIVVRDGRYRLYYKGRAMGRTPAQTRMGVAVAETPAGPYERLNGGYAVQGEGHEVLVWEQDGGVASLVTNAGEGLYFAADGIQFVKTEVTLEERLAAPGAFRPELSRHDASGPIRWGVTMGRAGGDLHLERFEVDLPPRPWSERPRTTQPMASVETRAAAAGWLAGGTWFDQHHDINRIGIRRRIDIVFLGDSITQSWGGEGRNVAAPAADVWRRHFGGLGAANFGISGDRTEHVLWRIDHGNFEHIRPRVVVLLIGTNNLTRDRPEAIADGVAAIVDRLAKKVPGVRVLLLGILPRGERPDDPMRDAVSRTNALVRVLDERPDVRFVDLGASMLLPDGRADRSLFRGDSLHLTEEGYRAMAEAIAPVLAEMLETSPLPAP